MQIKKAEFVKSCSSIKDLPKTGMQEIAFVGRSNVGKSSLINFLTNRKKLAQTSSTPGKTKLINYFLINNEFYFVDLPGYGYAEVSKEMQKNWGKIIHEYLQNSRQIVAIFLLLDIRRIPNEHDQTIVNWIIENNIPLVIILTKCDKLSLKQQDESIDTIRKTLNIDENIKLFRTSVLKKKGKEEILDLLDILIGVTNK